MREKSLAEVVNDKSMKFSYRKLNEINERSLYKNLSPKIAYTEYMADKLVGIYDAPKSRDFFLKCAWHLSEDTIWSAVEDSRKKKVKSPIKLFVYLCNLALKERLIGK